MPSKSKSITKEVENILRGYSKSLKSRAKAVDKAIQPRWYKWIKIGFVILVVYLLYRMYVDYVKKNSAPSPNHVKNGNRNTGNSSNSGNANSQSQGTNNNTLFANVPPSTADSPAPSNREQLSEDSRKALNRLMQTPRGQDDALYPRSCRNSVVLPRDPLGVANESDLDFFKLIPRRKVLPILTKTRALTGHTRSAVTPKKSSGCGC